MPIKKVKSERGVIIRVHPIFKSNILDRMDREVQKKLGLDPRDIHFNNVVKTKKLTESIMKQGINFNLTPEEKRKRRKRGDII